MNEAQKRKFNKVMHEWGQGKLKSSNGEPVTDQKQALAIAFSESGTGRKDMQKHKKMIKK